jgi:hypothetical protein
MALSTTEQTQLRAIITREGGLQAFADEVQDLYIKDRQAAALTALSGAISVAVTNWAALATYVAQADNITLYAALDAITQAAAARDASKLGPLFAELYAAAKNHLGR